MKCGASGFSTLLLVEIKSNVKFFPDGSFECFQRNHTLILEWWDKFDNAPQMQQGLQNLIRIRMPRRLAGTFVLTFVDFLCFKLCCEVRFNRFVAVSERKGETELIRKCHLELRLLQAHYADMFEASLSNVKPSTVTCDLSSEAPRDIIARFIGEHFENVQDSTVEFDAVWDMFHDYIMQHELPEISKKALGSYMKRNFVWAKKGVIYYRGLKAKHQDTKEA